MPARVIVPVINQRGKPHHLFIVIALQFLDQYISFPDIDNADVCQNQQTHNLHPAPLQNRQMLLSSHSVCLKTKL